MSQSESLLLSLAAELESSSSTGDCSSEGQRVHGTASTMADPCSAPQTHHSSSQALLGLLMLVTLSLLTPLPPALKSFAKMLEVSEALQNSQQQSISTAHSSSDTVKPLSITLFIGIFKAAFLLDWFISLKLYYEALKSHDTYLKSFVK